jgi:mycothiol synthase
MQPGGHADVVAERGGVVARVLDGPDRVDAALALLDRAEQAAGVPLVDEAERARLQALSEGAGRTGEHHHGVLARRGTVAVGYAGIVLPDPDGGRAVGDIAVAREHQPCGDTIHTLLGAMEALAGVHAAERMQVWIRHAGPDDVRCAADAGYGVERRLGVLGRDLTDLHDHDWGRDTTDPLPAGWRLRAYVAGADEDAVVSLLRAAYAGTPEGGWEVADLVARTDYEWFAPQDLLLAEGDDGRLGGLHWTKRRGDGVGEVYNLAVAPPDHGRGVGASLLHAGLHHLRDVGCTEVLLWVDLGNEAAVRLYTSQGFATRWEDVALTRRIRSAG